MKIHDKMDATGNEHIRSLKNRLDPEPVREVVPKNALNCESAWNFDVCQYANFSGHVVYCRLTVGRCQMSFPTMVDPLYRVQYCLLLHEM